jgi:hypothetical protein
MRRESENPKTKELPFICFKRERFDPSGLARRAKTPSNRIKSL